MTLLSHRRRPPAGPSRPLSGPRRVPGGSGVRGALAVVGALTLFGAAAGCTAADATETAAVPSPAASTAALCGRLHDRLPDRLSGLARNDPKPASDLTAGWGDPAIILRCGVPRPAALDAASTAGADDDTTGVDVDGVGWLVEERDDGSYRFTSTLRLAYVEVALPAARASEGVAPLTDLAGPVRKSVPEGIAD